MESCFSVEGSVKNCAIHYFMVVNSLVGAVSARGGITRPDERKITII